MSTKSTTHLPDLGVYGFDRFEPVILASLVTEDPMLLIGRSGTGKTFLLNSLSEALGLDHQKIPQTVVLGADGQVLHHARGPMDEAQISRVYALLMGS